MKYLFLTILLLSCSKSVLTVSQDKPIFQLGMPFEGGSAVEPVKSMPMWTPVVCTTFNSYVPSEKEVASCVKTILGVDTVTFPCTLYWGKIDSMMNAVQKRLYEDSVFIAQEISNKTEKDFLYLIGVIVIIVGAATVLILNFIMRKN